MSYEDVNSSMRGRQQLSSTQKKQILWNIIEPGDPYDIKKSMIAKLPGDRQNYMGDHIELVCLMQAAEIQRLCEYLQEYKLRYREIERRELDRHSYEVQIKELTQQLTDQGYHKTQNLKLRDFLKKQTAELEELRKKSSSEDGIGKKYQGALKQIEILFQENSTLKTEKTNLTLELQQLMARLSALESTKQRELDELRYTLTTQTNANYEREKQELVFKFQTEINRLDFQVKRLKDINDTKNREIQELQLRYRRVQGQLDEEISKQSHFVGLENTMHEYESKFGVLSKEIQRLNYVLRNKANECEELSAKLRQLDDQLVRRNHEVDEYNERIRRYEVRVTEMTTVNNDLNTKLRQLGDIEIVSKRYEQKIQQLSLQIERLNNVLKKKLTEITEYQSKLSDLEYELKKIDLVKRENQELRRFVNENSELKRRLAEFENKIPLLSNQIERLNGMLRTKSEESGSWELRCKNYERQIEAQRVRIEGYEREISSNWKSRITMVQQQNSNYQRENQDLRRRVQDMVELTRRLTEYENRIAMMSQEIERLNVMMKEVRDQNQDYRRKLMEAGDLGRRNNEYEARIAGLMGDIQQINESSRLKLTEYETRIREYRTELERVNSRLKLNSDEQQAIENRIKALIQENEQLRRGHGEIESRYTQEIQSKIATYESRIRQFSTENEDAARRFSEYERKIAMLSQQLQRINGILRSRNEEYSGLELKYRNSQQELENSRRQISQDFQIQVTTYETKLKQVYQENEEYKRRLQEFGDINRRISEYENRIVMLSQEIERMNGILRTKVDENNALETKNRALQQELDSQKKGVNEYEYRFTQITQEMQTRVTTYETKIKQANQENDDLRRRLQELADSNRKLSEYENRIMLLSQELERLNNNLRAKVQQCNGLENKLRSLQAEYDGTRRGVSEYEYKITQITQEYQSKVGSYDLKIKQISQENDELRRRLNELGDVNRKLSEYENKIGMLGQELERVNGILRTKTEENFALDSKLKSSTENFKRVQSELQSRYNQEFQSKITIYESKIKELGESSRKIPEYESRLLMLGQELERVTSINRSRVDQMSIMEGRLRTLQQENQSLRRNQGDIEIRVNQEFKTKIVTYESRIKQADGEIEEARRRLQELAIVNREYEDRIALLSQQIDRLNGNLRNKMEESSGIENRLRSVLQELQGYKRGTGEIQFKLKQYSDSNEELKRRIIQLSEINKNLPEYENRLKMLTQDLDKANSTIRALQQENEGLKRAQNDAELHYSRQIQTQMFAAETRIKTLEGQNEGLQRKIQEYDGELARKLAQFGNKTALMNQELERLNSVLKGKVDENLALENKLRAQTQELESLRRGGSETEYRIVQITQEFQSKITSSEDRIRRVTKESEDLKRRLQELSDVNRKITEYENRIVLLGQELERLNGTLRIKVQQNGNLETRIRTMQQENDTIRRGTSEFEYKLTQVTQEFQLKMTTFESRNKQLVQENEELRRNLQDTGNVNRKISEYESRVVLLSQQLERLNGNLRNKVDENNNLELTVRNLQQENDKLRKIQSEYDLKVSQEYQVQITTFESRLKQSYQENEEMRRRLQDLSDVNRKLNEYEMKIANLSQEIDRLNGVLRGKVEENNAFDGRLRSVQQENDGLRKAINEYEFKFTQITQEFQLKIRTIETSLKTTSQDNEELRLRLRDASSTNSKLPEYETKIALMAQEIERLNGLLKGKVDENSNYENRFRAYQQEIEGLKRVASELEFKLGQEHQLCQDLKGRLQGMGDINRKIAEYESKIALMSQEIQRLNSVLRIKTEEGGSYENRIRSLQDELNLSRRGIGQYEFKVTQITQEYQVKITSYETRIKQLGVQNEDLRRKLQAQGESVLSQYETKLSLLSQEVERLNYVLKTTNDELEEHRQKDYKYLTEIERLNNTLRLKVQESSRYEVVHADLLNRIKILEERNNQIVNECNGLRNTNVMLSSEYENSKKHLLEYEQSIKKLYAEFERLQTIMQELKKENYNLKVQLRESEGLIEKNRVLSAEIDRLTEIIEIHKSEISELRIRFADQAALHKRINEHMALMVVLFAEIESLRQRVKDKEKEVEDVRRSSLAPFKV